ECCLTKSLSRKEVFGHVQTLHCRGRTGLIACMEDCSMFFFCRPRQKNGILLLCPDSSYFNKLTKKCNIANEKDDCYGTTKKYIFSTI
ncbi:Uncharacterised protein at_DN0349, partial [Pycnogonum litorale]